MRMAITQPIRTATATRPIPTAMPTQPTRMAMAATMADTGLTTVLPCMEAIESPGGPRSIALAGAEGSCGRTSQATRTRSKRSGGSNLHDVMRSSTGEPVSLLQQCGKVLERTDGRLSTAGARVSGRRESQPDLETPTTRQGGKNTTQGGNHL